MKNEPVNKRQNIQIKEEIEAIIRLRLKRDKLINDGLIKRGNKQMLEKAKN